MKPEPDDIRRIARAARPSGKDDHDPEIRAALYALSSHPELAEELERERNDDLAISKSYREIEPPAELEQQLIDTLRRTRRAEKEAANTKVVSINRRSWLGLAAAAALTIAGALWWRQAQRLPLNKLVSELADISRKGVTLSLMSMQTDEVVEWLVQNQAPRADSLPNDLQALGRKGCHIYDIEGHRVSLECFLLPGMRELHLFTTPRSSLSGAPSPNDPKKIHTEGDQTAAIWSQGENTMILLSSVPSSEISDLLNA
jgi:hypothetical protein